MNVIVSSDFCICFIFVITNAGTLSLIMKFINYRNNVSTYRKQVVIAHLFDLLVTYDCCLFNDLLFSCFHNLLCGKLIKSVAVYSVVLQDFLS